MEKNKTAEKPNSSSVTPAPNLPNIDSSQIIRTSPKLIKENFSNTETKKEKK